MPAAPRGGGGGSSVRSETRPSSHNKGGRARAAGRRGAGRGGQSWRPKLPSAGWRRAEGGAGKQVAGRSEPELPGGRGRAGERPREPLGHCGRGEPAADPGASSPQPARQLATCPGLRGAQGRGPEAATNLRAAPAPPPPPQRASGPAGVWGAGPVPRPSPQRRDGPAAARAGGAVPRGVSGLRRRPRRLLLPALGSADSSHPQTRCHGETYAPAGVTSPATPGSLSADSGAGAAARPLPEAGPEAAPAGLMSGLPAGSLGRPGTPSFQTLAAPHLFKHPGPEGWAVPALHSRGRQQEDKLGYRRGRGLCWVPSRTLLWGVLVHKTLGESGTKMPPTTEPSGTKSLLRPHESS